MDKNLWNTTYTKEWKSYTQTVWYEEGCNDSQRLYFNKEFDTPKNVFLLRSLLWFPLITLRL